jgi:hypothetical protein
MIMLLENKSLVCPHPFDLAWKTAMAFFK